MIEQDAQRTKFPRRTQRREQTRVRIISAADKLFRTVGYGAATMNAIADEADVHVTTLFTHFKTKRDLAVSMNEQAAGRLQRLVEESKGQKPFFDFYLDLVLTMAARVESARQAGTVREAGSSLWHELGQDPELSFAWAQYERRQIELLTDYIAHEYGLDPAADYRPEMVANIMLCASNVSHRRWTDSLRPLDLQDETRKAVDLATRMARAVLAAS